DADASRRGADRLREPVRELLAASWAEPGADARAGDLHRRRVHLAAVPDVAPAPELLEVVAEAGGELGRVDGDDDVLLARPGVRGPVGRAAPDGAAVADHVLVVHQVRHPRDRGRLAR